VQVKVRRAQSHSAVREIDREWNTQKTQSTAGCVEDVFRLEGISRVARWREPERTQAGNVCEGEIFKSVIVRDVERTYPRLTVP
jgi:hypothetical protein